LKQLLKKSFFLLFACFLAWQSYYLIIDIGYLQNPNWIIGFFVACLYNLYITGFFAFLGFALAIERLFPKAYYKVRFPGFIARLSVLLGLKYFRYLLLISFWRSKKRQQKFFGGGKSGLQNLNQASMKAEFGHLLSFITLCIITIYLIDIGFKQMAFWCFIINLLFNFYPILLQRHHRMRIQGLL